jgi:hypothetical protein
MICKCAPDLQVLSLLLAISFAMQKLFSLMQSCVSVLALVACAFGVLAKESLLRSLSWHFPLMFPSSSSIVFYTPFSVALQAGRTSCQCSRAFPAPPCSSRISWVEWIMLLYHSVSINVKLDSIQSLFLRIVKYFNSISSSSLKIEPHIDSFDSVISKSKVLCYNFLQLKKHM